MIEKHVKVNWMFLCVGLNIRATVMQTIVAKVEELFKFITKSTIEALLNKIEINNHVWSFKLIDQ